MEVKLPIKPKRQAHQPVAAMSLPSQLFQNEEEQDDEATMNPMEEEVPEPQVQAQLPEMSAAPQ